MRTQSPHSGRGGAKHFDKDSCWGGKLSSEDQQAPIWRLVSLFYVFLTRRTIRRHNEASRADEMLGFMRLKRLAKMNLFLLATAFHLGGCQGCERGEEEVNLQKRKQLRIYEIN